MADPLPPPLPIAKSSRSNRFAFRAIMAFGIVGGLAFAGLTTLRAVGAVRVFSVPTNGMAPAVDAGDHVVMRGLITPRRGDIVVFNTGKIPPLGPINQVYLKRLAGLPGETLRIADGKLHVNGVPTPLRNKEGEIYYQNSPRLTYLTTPEKTVTVPENMYFVLGDNSGNSADSRYWGFVPKESVIGRVSYCYYPPARSGPVE